MIAISSEVCAVRIKGIEIWGDSLFRGILFDGRRKRHVICAENAVALAQKAIGLCVENHAHMGYTVRNGYQSIQKIDPGHMKDRLVLLEFGGNDCDFNWAEVACDPYRAHQCRVPPEQYRQTLTDMIALVKAAGGVPVLTTLPPLDAPKYFSWITRNNEAARILEFLGDIHQIYRWQEYYSLMNLDIAKTNGLLCLPLREYILSKGSQGAWMCDDGIHPNERCHKWIFEVFMQQWRLNAVR